MAAPKWTARTWREWFFEVFAPNGYIRPLRLLPLTDAERRERAERTERDIPGDITRINISDGGESPPRE
jgi:hypothetical protein